MAETMNIVDILVGEPPYLCTRTRACKWIMAGDVYIDGELVRDRRQRFDINEINEIQIRGEVAWTSKNS